MKTNRVEAFSDGVFAIIITVLVLELPRPNGHSWHTFTTLWPTLLSYLLSFIYVGIYWNNHHHMFMTVDRVNGAGLWSNLHQLFWLSLFPYVTGWAGESHFAPVPMTCYAFVALMCAVAFTILSITMQAANKDNSLLSEAVGRGHKETTSLIGYSVAVIAPFFGEAGAVVSGIILIITALIWLIPDPRIERRLAAIEAEENRVKATDHA